ncbi:MAG: hypothetical protein H7A44_08530 [Opitutaceae bacterium]|nr:hypothetical protein [Cephaloticoccus sp.]MCP5530476.1 hypothetical protein [Opitutaceae bacterium]
MKYFSYILLICITTAGLRAQWIVNDPVNTSVNLGIQSAQAANHLEVLKKWGEQLTALQNQIRQLEEQLAEQRRIREVLGNPTLAGGQLILDRLGPEQLAREYGETLREIRKLANSVSSLQRSAEGIYPKLDDHTVLGQSFERQTTPYRRYAAVERQAEQAAEIYDTTLRQQAELQTDLAGILDRLKSAGTQAEVDKLAVNANAINGQLYHLVNARRDQTEALRMQQIENENQRAKEQTDRLEKQIAEEQQSQALVNAWQQSVQLGADHYSRP